MVNCGKIEPCIGCPAVVSRDAQPGETVIRETSDSFRVISVNDLKTAPDDYNYVSADITNSEYRQAIADCENPVVSTKTVTHRRWLGSITKTVTSVTCPPTQATKITRVR